MVENFFHWLALSKNLYSFNHVPVLDDFLFNAFGLKISMHIIGLWLLFLVHFIDFTVQETWLSLFLGRIPAFLLLGITAILKYLIIVFHNFYVDFIFFILNIRFQNFSFILLSSKVNLFSFYRLIFKKLLFIILFVILYLFLQLFEQVRIHYSFATAATS